MASDSGGAAKRERVKRHYVWVERSYNVMVCSPVGKTLTLL